MSLIEKDTYTFLSTDNELIQLMNSIRGQKFDETGRFGDGIFIYQLPESYSKIEVAPFIRIEPVLEMEAMYFDDDNRAEEQRVQVSFWTKGADASDMLKRKIDKIMKENGLRQYDANRYHDPDIDLIMHYRKYRRYEWQ